MEETRLADDLDLASVHLLNDPLAVAYAVPSLNGSDLRTLNKGRAAKGGTIAVVAPGTGLGEAYLIWDGAGYRAHPSEGGHADFAPNNTLEAEMLMHLRKHFEHVSYERVCSGSGLPNIYAFLKDSGHAEEPDWLADQLAAAHDPTPVIVTAALDLNRPCRLCQATLNIFVSILGAETGNMALKVMASGGVYLGGGIPPRIISTLQSGIFMEAFGRKGRMSRLMTEVPVYVIMNPKAALWGAACQAFHPQEHANVEKQE
jgi:glucokinase